MAFDILRENYEDILLSGVTLLFEHSPSQLSEIKHFEIFNRPYRIKTSPLVYTGLYMIGTAVKKI